MGSNKINPEEVKERLGRIFREVIEESPTMNKSIDEMDGFTELMSGEYDRLYKFLSSHLIMFRYRYDGSDAILMLFGVPTKTSEKSKYYSERVMEIIGYLEDIFVFLDYLEVKEDNQYNYIISIKKIEES